MTEISFNELARIFGDVSADVEGIVEEALNVNAEDLLSQSIDYAPLDEGGLRENGAADKAKKEGEGLAAYVGFNKEYALRMHEDIYTAQVAGTGRKYLEKPTTQNAEKYSDYIAKKVKGGFK